MEVEKDYEILNCTPHSVRIESKDGYLDVAPSGIVARCKTVTFRDKYIKVQGTIISTTRTSFGEVENLPSEKDGQIIVVSGVVVEACTNRLDLYSPNEIVRDDKGEVLYCKSITRR